MIYDKKQLYAITRKIYRNLRENPDCIILKKIRGNQGEYDYTTSEIFIDYRCNILSTLIHEYLHKWHPDKSESWVLKHEQLIVNALSTRQIRNLLGAFGAAVSHHS